LALGRGLVERWCPVAEENTALELLSEARRTVEKAKTVQELKGVRDKAEAVRQYAKQAGMGLEIQNHCAEVKILAERKTGGLLDQMGLGPGNPQWSHGATKAKLADLGLNKTQSSRWQAEAAVPEADFAKHVKDTQEAGKELTSLSVVRLAKRRKPTKGKTPPFPKGMYRCVVIDPPWPIQKIEREERPLQGNQLDYQGTLTVDEIQTKMGVFLEDHAVKDGCHVYLWVTHRFLPTGFDLFKAWGVKYECLMTWVKNVGFTPFSWMYDTEHVLFGRLGSLEVAKKGLRLSFSAKVQGHSRKPDEFYDRVRQASPENRVDMFGREAREGFEVWGNEATD